MIFKNGINQKISLGIILSLCYSLLVTIFVLSCNPPKNNKAELDKLIKVERIRDNVALFKLGYDAVIAISTQKGIVVVDAGISNSLTAKYRILNEKEFNKKIFAYLINTHSHWDHTGGNQVFSDAVIVGQKNCINEMTEFWKDKAKKKEGVLKIINDYKNRLTTSDITFKDSLEIYKQIVRYQHTYNDLSSNRKISLPEKTFEDTLSIYTGDMSFYLLYFGKAHSNSDILIYIPEVKVLLVGDLFSKYGRPSFHDFNKLDKKRWTEVKCWIEKRLNNIDIIINGHGEVLRNTDLFSFKEFIDKKRRL
ncbi:MAG: MBL fold metallo-hydrolase [Ignavibacteriales bacterium]|nr:MAG: MBL fold metallo-hydrolase [Ignavibacteriales bacterium]